MGTPHRYKVFALLFIFLGANGGMQQAHPNAEELKARQTGPFIIVVDDSALYRDTIQAVLEQNGYQTLTANDGAAGLALFREQGMENTRAVITDLDMPVMDGLQLLDSIQRLAPELKVICISGSPTALAKVPQVPGRVVALQKMAGIDELLARLAALLRD